jgi:Protein prenyltransferase alpha subunit repeat
MISNNGTAMANLSSMGMAVLEALADLLCGPERASVSELGVYFAPVPPENEQTISAAIRVSAHALGVASWALSPLYRAAKARIASSRNDVRAATAMLVATPDYATAWAIRREEIMRRTQKAAEIESDAAADDELALCALILSRSPKSVEAWTHRSWVLRVFGWTDKRVETELELCVQAASAASCNYYAGVHRAQSVARATPHALVAQVTLSREWLKRHVSDCSGWWFHTHAMILTCKFQREDLSNSVLASERSFAEDMHRRYGEKYECVRKYHAWIAVQPTRFVKHRHS